MNVRATIAVEGTVQQVGYRDFVFELAVRAGLKGWVRNREDGSVEIVCEGPKGAIEQFAKNIRIEEPPILVDNLKINYGEATGEFRQFKIDWKANVNEAIMERMGTAARYLRELKTEVRGVGSEVKCVGQKVEGVGSKVDNLTNITVQSFADLGGKVDKVGDNVLCVGAKVDKLTATTVQSFAHMDLKYDKISKAMVDIVQELREDRKQVRVEMKQCPTEMKQLIQAVLKSRK